jgi:hypothetical protein
MSSVHDPDPQVALGELTTFRHELYECLSARADALFELTDAVLCTQGPVRSLVDLSWHRSTGVGTARSTTESTTAVSTSHACGILLPVGLVKSSLHVGACAHSP